MNIVILNLKGTKTMTEMQRLKRLLSIVVYQYTLIEKLKGQSKTNLESTTRDLFDLAVEPHPGLFLKHKTDDRASTAKSMLEAIEKLPNNSIGIFPKRKKNGNTTN